MKKPQTNKGRNVINIQAIQNYLNNYTQEKKLSTPIDSWLQNTFVRWLINHFTKVEIVSSVEQYKLLLKGNIPTWFNTQSNIKFIYIDIKDPSFLDTLNTCVEFLSSRDENLAHKFPRMTVEHVLKKSEREHQRMKEKKRKFIETSKEALEHVFTFKNLHVVKFLPHHKELSLEMARESALMQHCLGEFENVEKGEGGYGSYYFGLIKKEAITLYSLRDEKNMPHATISVTYKRGEAWLDQIKGKQNKAPVERYIPASVAFFNHLKLQQNYHQDCLAMNVVYAKGKSEQLSKITDEAMQQHFIAYDPSFIEHLPNPSKSSLWLAALRDPKQMGNLANTTDSMKIASLLQYPLLLNELEFSNDLKGKKVLQQKEDYCISNRTFVFPKLEVARI